MRLHLGCGRNILPGWINVDKAPLPGVDLIADLDACRFTHLRMPGEAWTWMAADSVSEILMVHVLEHIRDTLGLMQELHRVAEPNAICTVILPYGGSDGAWEDQTHVRPYFPKSFGYFSQPYHWRADYDYHGDWQPERVQLLVSKEICEAAGNDARIVQYRIEHERNIVSEMTVWLRCVKPIRPAQKELQELPLWVITPVPDA